ncbi:hypothetical protein LTR53_016507 [Teratosphaeriaceae sp. CCFEE 6253]|nr:hypothetical protein LTR53_016507 [Teratosphaeriaceae sp. CCFEE 6253]
MSYAANDPITNPSPTPKNENPGMVTSDSLAAESVQSGGSFGANSEARGPMSQPSASTNTNTTDTSSATELPAAVDRTTRGDDSGVGSTGDTSSASGGSGGSGSSSYASAAGGGATTDDIVSQIQKPKGSNVTEGGFDDDAPNVSFSTDIGGKDDPGRAALGGMEARNARAAGGEGPRQYGQAGDGGQFAALGGDASA